MKIQLEIPFPLDLYDLGEFFATIEQSIDEETGEYNTRTAPASLLEIREWAIRLQEQHAATVAQWATEEQEEPEPPVCATCGQLIVAGTIVVDADGAKHGQCAANDEEDELP